MTITNLAGADTQKGFADGKGSAAQFCTVEDLTLDDAGNLYVPDWGNNSVRQITPDGTVSTYLGLSTGYTKDAPRNKSGVYQPYRVQYDAASKQLFVVGSTGADLKVVTTDDYVYGLVNQLTTSPAYADNSAASKHPIYSMAVNKKGEVFILDKYNHCIRKLTIVWK